MARQPPTIVTWAELHFYDLPFDPSKWFRKRDCVPLGSSRTHLPAWSVTARFTLSLAFKKLDTRLD
jgi:hypothetical protein